MHHKHDYRRRNTYDASGMERFRARLGGEEGERPLVELPFDARASFGKARAPVRGRVNGVEFRNTVAVYGGRSYVGFNKELRERAGIEMGDDVEVELELDDAPREVELPPELEGLLAGDRKAREFFEGLSFTHRREYAEWIAGAKKDETRRRRLTRTHEMLRARKKHP
jgi:bifunctional DNA-binding transcriptional regulator/antitoxin component of YhaV-PrlF toxin-antitoxin module